MSNMPPAHLMASGSRRPGEDGTIGWCNIRKNEMTIEGEGHEFLNNSLMFYQQGSRIMTSAGDNSTRLWDVENQTQISELKGTGVMGIAVISEDGKICLTGSDDLDKKARAWSKNKVDNSWTTLDAFDEMLASVRELKEYKSITSIALSPTANRGLLCFEQGVCLLFSVDKNTKQFKTLDLIDTGQKYITTSVFHPDGKCFYTGNFDGKITKWEFDGRLIQAGDFGRSLVRSKHSLCRQMVKGFLRVSIKRTKEPRSGSRIHQQEKLHLFLDATDLEPLMSPGYFQRHYRH